MKIGSCGVHREVAKHTSFLIPTMVGGDIPFYIKCAPKVAHPSEKRRLRPIFAYNVSTVTAREKDQLSRIGSLPRAFLRAIDDELRTLPLRSPKGGSIRKFVIFVNKNQFKSNKLGYKVSLCKNFQRQSCSRTIPLSNGVYMLTVNVTLKPKN